MLKKLKSKGRRLAAFLLSLITIISSAAVPTATVFAADGTLHFNSGENIPYGTYVTARMTFDGSNTAYCLEPSKKTPEVGDYEYELLPQGSPIRKALYYLNGGYGYEKITKDACFEGWSDTDSYVIGHLALAYIYDNYSDGGDAFHGATPELEAKAKEVVDFINGQPEPPESFQAFILPAENHQTIAGSWYEEPFGWIELYKSTANGNVSNGNGNYTLAGARYGIYKDGNQVAVLTTDGNGYAKSEALETGGYTVQEISPSAGYAVDPQSYDVRVESDETAALNVTEVPQNNPMDLTVQKIDSETGRPKPQGGAAFKDAQFTVKFYVEQMDKDPAASGKKPVRTWVFKTDAEGRAKFTKDYLVSGDAFYYQTNGTTPCLPLGTVTVQETKAPEGYFINKDIFVRKITGDGKQESVACYQAPSVPEQVYRGDLEFVKVSDGDLSRLANVPFSITSKTTGESHVIVTDKNGYASTSSSWTKHSINTNAGTASTDGIWFGTSKPNDNKGALIYDTYVIGEQRCRANEGMNLLKFEVSIYKDAVTVQLGTLTNDHLDIGTTALDKRTGSHAAKADEKVVLVDTVEYEGLRKGQEYKLIGTLMDKETGEPILIDGKAVTAEKTFKAKNTSGSVEVTFTFNGIILKGKTVVVFEELYQEDLKLAVHTDIEDEEQTIYFPEIGTTAKDADTEENISHADEEVILVDTVAYKNLVPGEEYKATGTLMDKETGKPVEAGGKPITAEAVFMPEETEGTVEVTFVFNGMEVKGKTVVVFESVTLNGKELAVHADLEDEGQTIYFPEIGTTAKDSETGGHVSNADENVTIVDTVSYKNLITGKEYKITGTLMDKETKEPLMVEGKPVTAETVFTPTETEGTVEITFTFNGSALKGKTVVAFETVTYKGREVASHTDIEDKEQSIYFPEIHTTAKDGKDGDKEILAGEKATLIDTVEYKNLEADQEYRLVGTLMDKETGKAVLIDGKEVTAEAFFKPEKTTGKADVTFTFNATEFAGRKLVVFEKLFLVKGDMETEISAHEDLKDEGQTVKIVKTEMPKARMAEARTPKTGDESHMGFWYAFAGISVIGLAAFAVLKVRAGKKKEEE